MDSLIFSGYFAYERWSPGGVLLARGHAKNMVTTAALNEVLNTYFNSAAQHANWYLGLIDLASFTALAAADTMASHAGWLEQTNYSQATRPAWGQGTATGASISNPGSAIFTLTGQLTVHGLFVASDNTKGGTTGTLWSTALLDSDQQFNNGEVFKLSYTLSDGSN